MGEYAKSNNREIKIGTCATMYYLRYEDRFKITPLPGNVNPATENDLYFRIPFPDEDSILPGNYTPYNRGLRLSKDNFDFETDECCSEIEKWEGIIQLTHPSGLLVNLPCYHGKKLPEGAFWNGKSWHLELAHIKKTESGAFPVVRCRFCGVIWCFEWSKVLPYVSDNILKSRLEKIANEQIYKIV